MGPADDLFTASQEDRLRRQAPLAARMRPRTLDEMVGQRHLLAERNQLVGERTDLARRLECAGAGPTSRASTRRRVTELFPGGPGRTRP